MKKVCLVNLSKGREYGQIDEGLGLASSGLEWIAGVLKQRGHDVRILDQGFSNLSDLEVIRTLQHLAPDIIGFNPLSSHREIVQEIALGIKAACEGVVTVVGGYDATFLPLENYQGIDYVVRGRGEIAMAELVENISKGSSEKIKGVAGKTENGIDEKMEERADILQSDQMPLPYRSDEYLEELVKRNEPMSIVASVGCEWNCSFCATPRMYPEGRKERPLENVLAEIDYCVARGVKKFSFWDENFFGKCRANILRADKIIQHIKNAKYPDGTVGGVITFSFITPAGMILAESMGIFSKCEGTVNRIYVGIEGGCAEALANLGNNSCLNPDANAKAISIARKYQIGLQMGFIMFNPYSTFEELGKSAQFLLDNDAAATGISFLHRVRPYPGTKMLSKLHQDGLLIEEVALKEIDLYQGIPYYFQHDLETGETNMKNFALAMGKISADQRVNTSEKLVNEIDTRYAACRLSRQVFDKHQPEGEEYLTGDQRVLIREYRALRKWVGELNYNLFMESLVAFRDQRGKGINELTATYFKLLDQGITELQKIKNKVSDVAEGSQKVDLKKLNDIVIYAAKSKCRFDQSNQFC